jgi:hypothetical protein
MKDLLDKLSSYNLFNYLFPGIIFSFASKEITSYSFHQKDIIIGVFVYYFIGLVISRIGSLLIEPFLKKVNFLKFSDYKDFISASKEDKKIELLSEENNMYRTICSLFFLLLFLKFYELLGSIFQPLNDFAPFILALFLLAVFTFSYKKRTNYIAKRVNAQVQRG